MGAWWLTGLVLSCAKAPPVSLPPPTPSAEPSFPLGWWATKAFAARFDPSGYVVVAKDGSTDRRMCSWEWRGAYWACFERPDDLLYPDGEALIYGVGASGQRLEPVEEVERYERAIVGLPEPADVCPRAEACCRAMGGECEGFGTSVYACRAGIEALREMAERETGQVPDACQSDR
ncbi:MAG: hypothetical protein AAGA48_18915 [Myxococcota bacterium]